MSIKKIFSRNEFYDIKNDAIATSLPETFHDLIEYGILASKKDPFDPMEKALHDLGKKTLHSTEHLHEDWNILEEYPLSRELLSLSHVYKHPETGAYYVSAKGAPEAIFDLCHLDNPSKEDLAGKVNIIAQEGLRVLGVAKAKYNKNELPENQHDFEFEFIGLIGLTDPVRGSVPQAIKECYSAGIRVVMITGDYPATAQNIASQIGLKNIDQVITGLELAGMSPTELKDKISVVNIFARVVPEQKLLLVNALKENGEVVAMTGDGVNDAPALKAANIGVAMGERGTDVARESSDIVLLQDDFASIVAAVRLGRRIFDNLKKAMAYIISVHVPIAGIALIPVLCGWPIVLYPVHILFLELIIDPACSIVFEQEKEEANIMQRRPRDPGEPLFGKKLLLLSVLQGLFSLGVIMIVYKTALMLGQPVAEARTLSFVTLIISNLCLIISNRSWSRSIIASLSVPNTALKWVISSAALFLGLVIYTPFLQKVFHFGWMHFTDVLIALAAGIISVVWFEIVKMMSSKKHIELMNN
jgi:P-type Ca2+ transporter type 2C